MKKPQFQTDVKHEKFKILQQKLLDTYAKSKGFKNFEDMDNFLTELKILTSQQEEEEIDIFEQVIASQPDEEPFRQEEVL